ncbi:MAG TPA: VOC family protein [Gemmataceae bacterium]|nr:VOC family protein [Gemmataceae bacterium]
MPVKPIPDGYHTVTPYLIVKGAAQALDFYKKAFGATELFRMPGPDGRVMHAEFRIGSSPIMIGDECPQMGATAPQPGAKVPVTLHLYVENVDAFVDRAVSAGATVVRPLANQFYGDRSCGLACPFGHSWYVATHIEDVSMEEMQKRMAAMPKP